MKTEEELNALRNEAEALSNQLAELTEEELAVVSGGHDIEFGLIRQLLEIITAPLKEDGK